MNEKDQRMHILDQIERGEISAEEGMGLLREMNVPSQETEAVPATDSAGAYAAPAAIPLGESQDQSGRDDTSRAPGEGGEDGAGSGAQPVEGEVYTTGEGQMWPADADRWRRWWMVPLWIGVGIVAIAGLLMLWAYQAAGFGFWFFCTGSILVLGLAVLVLAAQSRTARWLHLRIKQKPGHSPQNIAISLPIPLRFARWAMRIFGGFIPDVGGASASDIMTALDALEQSATPENPVYIQVDEDGGEHVEIYIG